LSVFLLTLLVFWASRQLPRPAAGSENYKASTNAFLLDHRPPLHATSETDPELSVWLSTPVDRSQFDLTALYREDRHQGDFRAVGLIGKIGSPDRFQCTLPRHPKGAELYYHLELRDESKALLARLPQESDREIALRFEGEPSLELYVANIGLLFLTMLFGFLALFDTFALRSDNLRLRNLSRKVVIATLFLIAGGIVTGALVMQSRYDYLWRGWPLGENLQQTLLLPLLIYWVFLIVVFKGTIFRFQPEKNIVSANGATLLTLLGVFFMLLTYLVGAAW